MVLIGNMSDGNSKFCDTIKTDTEQVKKKGKKRKKIQKPTSEEEIPRKKITRPNFFIGVRINASDILGRIHALHEYVKEGDERLCKAIVPITATHVTLAVMHLNEDEGDIEKVCNILNEKNSEIEEIIGKFGFEIVLEGIGNFRQEVVFVKISSGEHLEKLSDLSDLLVKSCGGFCDTGQRSFKPHVTVLKLSKMHGPRKKKLKKIPSFLYKPFMNMSFGKQKVVCFELLSMLKKKQANGYYHSECRLPLEGLKQDDSNRSWSVRNLADCMAVSSVTLAMLAVNQARGFADDLSDNIMQDVRQRFKKKSCEELKILNK